MVFTASDQLVPSPLTVLSRLTYQTSPNALLHETKSKTNVQKGIVRLIVNPWKKCSEETTGFMLPNILANIKYIV
jgi:hypothetical protein